MGIHMEETVDPYLIPYKNSILDYSFIFHIFRSKINGGFVVVVFRRN